MSKRAAGTVHRPQREGPKAKELIEAKHQVKSLGREVSRLRRRLEKYETAEETDTEAEEVQSLGDAEDKEVGAKRAPAVAVEPCECGSTSFKEILTPSGKTLRICTLCKFRKVV